MASKGALRLMHVDQRLSITNKHPCSTVALERAVKEWDGKGGVAMWLNDIQERMRHQLDLEAIDVSWARPEIEAFKDIIGRLRAKAV